jgi:hypothetical protein
MFNRNHIIMISRIILDKILIFIQYKSQIANLIENITVNFIMLKDENIEIEKFTGYFD